MKHVKLTCPFTGGQFEALEFADGKLAVKHAITGETFYMNWNRSIKRYNVSKRVFELIETVTFAQAAKILDVSRQRITQIARDQIVMPHDVNGTSVFILSELLEYKKNRKVGAPFKE